MLFLIIGLVGIQFLEYERTNPPVDQYDTLEGAEVVPPDVLETLRTSCYDCHSHETVWPWYSDVAPISWLLMGTVEEARSHLNFSVWNTYGDREKKLRSIAKVLQYGEMPPTMYNFINADKAPPIKEVSAVIKWAKGNVAVSDRYYSLRR